MEWQRKHARRTERADRRFSKRVNKALRETPKDSQEFKDRTRHAHERHERAYRRAAKSAGRRVNQDGTGCAVTALGVLGAAVVATLQARGLS